MATRCPARTLLSISSRGVHPPPLGGQVTRGLQDQGQRQPPGQGPEDGRRGGVIPQRGEQVLSQGWSTTVRLMAGVVSHGPASRLRDGAPRSRIIVEPVRGSAGRSREGKPTHSMRPGAFLAAIGVLAIVAAACGGAAPGGRATPGGEGGTAEEGITVGMALDVGGLGDKSFNDMTNAGLQLAIQDGLVAEEDTQLLEANRARVQPG